MKVTNAFRGVMLVVGLALMLSACTTSPDTAESRKVNDQQALYFANQPTHMYDWSLSRQLWIEFYDAQNAAVTTWSSIQPQTGGAPEFDCLSVGYPTARDTQLTNPMQKVDNDLSVIAQAEPNGLFTAGFTDATVVMCQNKNGTLSAVSTEQKITAFPFPVQWQVDADHPSGHFVRVGESQINLKTTH